MVILASAENCRIVTAYAISIFEISDRLIQSLFSSKGGRKMAGMKMALGVVCVMIVASALWAEVPGLADISLPAPRMQGGKPLMQALKDRQSSRTFGAKKLPAQMMADLLWAAAGINRPDSGKRTVPSARNWQEVEVYAVMEDGTYLYDAKANILRAVATGDQRKLTGFQDFVASAPLNLVYVADTTKMKTSPEEDLALYLGADTGFISQNVYLFCASEGLATVVRASVDRKALAEALKLPEQKKITLVQTVGYPPTEDR
jgi:SagB-type dehydrogenase family enzyme